MPVILKFSHSSSTFEEELIIGFAKVCQVNGIKS